MFPAFAAAWSFGLSAARTLFNAGAARAGVQGAEARHQAAVALIQALDGGWRADTRQSGM